MWERAGNQARTACLDMVPGGGWAESGCRAGRLRARSSDASSQQAGGGEGITIDNLTGPATLPGPGRAIKGARLARSGDCQSLNRVRAAPEGIRFPSAWQGSTRKVLEKVA